MWPYREAFVCAIFMLFHDCLFGPPDAGLVIKSNQADESSRLNIGSQCLTDFTAFNIIQLPLAAILFRRLLRASRPLKVPHWRPSNSWV